MRQFVRDILDDLKVPSQKETPAVKTVYLDPPKPEPVPEDLDNQILSNDAEQRVRQLDYQAQKRKEAENLP